MQRDLPRPTDMNDSVLRPLNSDPPLTELQRAEELIKREMIVMMHHDCVETPTPAQVCRYLEGDHCGLNLDFVEFKLIVPPTCPFAMPSLPNFHTHSMHSIIGQTGTQSWPM